MKWEKVKLGDVCKSIADGDHQAPKKQESGVPFITISNIDSNNRIDFKNCLYVSEEYYDAINDKRKATKDDILYSVVGSFGVPVLIKENIKFAFQRHIAILRPDKAKIFPAFMYYCMLAREFYLQADSVAIGSAQRTITLGALNNMQLALPPLLIQQRIASILSAYDDLIENNQKQIKLLEEAAQRLYKEWFVDLRFPGHESVMVVDGVPEGWKKEKLIDISDVQYGYAFNGSLFNSDGKGMPIIRIRDIPSGVTSDYTTEEAPQDYIVNNGDILIGMDGEFHINSWCGPSAYLVQRTCMLKPKEKFMQGWLLQAIYNPIKFFEKTIVGATVAHLGKKHIDSIELLVGSRGLYDPFGNLFHRRQMLLNQISSLREARDRLLPKLMSGEIEVEDTPSSARKLASTSP